ncbi:NAD(P)H-dependent oxidoreductase [Allokutzneria sp. A3M-2-11 16]|uniref:NAD(P)H-dependent oxidoreductase n=1 Tax=Allokutzneria sp. A3M-2-11 16 TaxID=2962043 RepID=UPI0020B71528|nr:NAD(P)H-dependent oxidoreductase [Allokutzneria sp. A3M-2-11 16]MCP3805099.1 NAD(P)H-dependent oxidoreductase [Allokutzneria sp. A3M-2-11 16]
MTTDAVSRLAHPDPRQRELAAAELGDLLRGNALDATGVEVVITGLVNLALGDDDPVIIEEALHAISEGAYRRILPSHLVMPLVRRMPSLTPELLEYVLDILASTRDPAVRPVLIAHLDHALPAIRDAAAGALPELPRPKLLHLDSSAGRSNSRSRAITAAFASAFSDAAPGNVVVHRDLHTEPLPHLPDPSLHWAAGLREADASPDPAAEDLQRRLVAELLSADVLLIGVPLYNYSLPSSLKAWLDHVHVPGLTAPSAISGAPLAGRPAVLVATRGGDYDDGTVNEGRDHATPVLQLILGEEMGMAVSVITTSLTLAKVDRAENEYGHALRSARDLGARLGRQR